MDKIYWSKYKLLVVKEGSGRVQRKLMNARDCYEYAKLDFKGRDRECFIRYDLNSKNDLIGKEVISVGTANASLVHPREVFKGALINSAISIIIVHNHPSGDPAPSVEDRKVTEVITKAGETLGIEVLDHVIVGESSYYSFTEED